MLPFGVQKRFFFLNYSVITYRHRLFFFILLSSPMEEGMTLHVYLFELPDDTLCHIELTLSEWFSSRTFLNVVTDFITWLLSPLGKISTKSY